MPASRVDVIICTNTDGRYLGEALDSVARQTWQSWAVTVVDDGSEDPEALRRVVAGRDRVRIIRQDHRGVAAARNTGVVATNAPWITFLDDDDLWHPRRLELLAGAREAAGDRAIASYSGGWNMDAAGASIGYEWDAYPATSEDMLRGAVPFPRLFTLLADRTAMEAAGPFDESYSLGEDNQFLLRFLTRGELVAVPERLVGYRRHGRNMTATREQGVEDASWRLLSEGMDAARAEGDQRLYRLIRENRRRWTREQARARAGDALHDARHGRLGMAARKMGRAIAASPRGAARGVREKVLR